MMRMKNDYDHDNDGDDEHEDDDYDDDDDDDHDDVADACDYDDVMMDVMMAITTARTKMVENDDHDDYAEEQKNWPKSGPRAA